MDKKLKINSDEEFSGNKLGAGRKLKWIFLSSSINYQTSENYTSLVPKEVK